MEVLVIEVGADYAAVSLQRKTQGTEEGDIVEELKLKERCMPLTSPYGQIISPKSN